MNLAIGAPGQELLPSADMLKRAFEGSLTDANLQYAPERVGGEFMNAILSKWLTERYNQIHLQPLVLESSLTVTTGASQSLFNIAALFVQQ